MSGGIVNQPALVDLPRTQRKLAPATAEVSATETVEGILELATQAETDAGSDDARAVTPLKLAAATTTGFPAGTAMLFQQTTAPTGWTKETTHNNKALRLQTGTVTSGGGDGFSTVFGTGKTTASHTLTTGEIAAHPHDIFTVADEADVTARVPRSTSDDGLPNATASGAALTAGGGGGHTHNLSNFNLQFVDVIIATKDA